MEFDVAVSHAGAWMISWIPAHGWPIDRRTEAAPTLAEAVAFIEDRERRMPLYWHPLGSGGIAWLVTDGALGAAEIQPGDLTTTEMITWAKCNT